MFNAHFQSQFNEKISMFKFHFDWNKWMWFIIGVYDLNVESFLFLEITHTML